MKRHDPDDAVCPACMKMIEPGMPVSFQHGDLLHRWCSEPRTAVKKLATPVGRGNPG